MTNVNPNSSSSDIFKDFYRGTLSSVLSTASTTPFFNMQTRIIRHLPVRWDFRSLYLGTGSNFLAYWGSLGFGNASRGLLNRNLEAHPLGDPLLERVVVPLLSGAAGACGALPWEVLMVTANKTKWGFWRCIGEVVIRQRKIAFLAAGGASTILRDSITIGAALGPAATLKDYLVKEHGANTGSAIVVSSIVTGMISATLSQPFQVGRIAVQDSAVVPVKGKMDAYEIRPDLRLSYRGAMKKIWKEKGVRGPFLGLLPRLGVTIVFTACQVLADEVVPSKKVCEDIN